MAIYKPSPLIGAIAGPVGGVTFVSSGRGQVIRRAACVPARHSQRQKLMRARWARFQVAWSALTAAQRAGWRTAAAVYRRTDRLGVPHPYSGFELFMLVNMRQYNYVSTVRTTPPAVIFGPSYRPTRWKQTPAGGFTIEGVVPGASTPYRLRFWGTTSSEARYRGWKREWKWFIERATSTGTDGLGSYWLSSFGRYPVAGQWVAVRIENITGCFASAPVVVECQADDTWYYPT